MQTHHQIVVDDDDEPIILEGSRRLPKDRPKTQRQSIIPSDVIDLTKDPESDEAPGPARSRGPMILLRTNNGRFSSAHNTTNEAKRRSEATSSVKLPSRRLKISPPKPPALQAPDLKDAPSSSNAAGAITNKSPPRPAYDSSLPQKHTVPPQSRPRKGHSNGSASDGSDAAAHNARTISDLTQPPSTGQESTWQPRNSFSDSDTAEAVIMRSIDAVSARYDTPHHEVQIEQATGSHVTMPDLPAVPTQNQIDREVLIARPVTNSDQQSALPDREARAALEITREVEVDDPALATQPDFRDLSQVVVDRSTFPTPDDHIEIIGSGGAIANIPNESSTASQQTIRVEAEDLISVLKKYEGDMLVEHEMALVTALRQAKLDSVKAPWPMLGRDSQDPFEKLHGTSFSPGDKHSAEIELGEHDSLKSRISIASHSQQPEGKINFVSVKYKPTTPPLPTYRSIVRLSDNILAKNDRNLKYLPYFPIDDGTDLIGPTLFEELRELFNDRVKTLPAQRICGEMTHYWAEHAEGFLEEIGIKFDDLLHLLLDQNRDDTLLGDAQLSAKALAAWRAYAENCPNCDMEVLEEVRTNIPKQRTVLADSLSKQKLILAGLACKAFLKVAKFSIWHIVLKESRIETRSTLLQDSQVNPIDHRPPMCSICHLHNCPTHGAYIEDLPDSPETGGKKSPEPSDEFGENIRQFVSTSKGIEAKFSHHCGPFCVAFDLKTDRLLGLRSDGEIAGAFNAEATEAEGTAYEDGKLCGKKCFWDIKNRESLDDQISRIGSSNFPSLREHHPNAVKVYETMLLSVSMRKRSPCLIALALPGVTCMEVFSQLIIDARQFHSAGTLSKKPRPGELKRNQTAEMFSEDSLNFSHDHRVSFVPCSHTGPCHKNNDCSCHRNRVSCERTCGCAEDCERRYQGCNCVARGNKVCFLDARCECWNRERECDAWLCSRCGVIDVLDPAVKHRADILDNRCKNANLQRNIPKRTLKGKSEVQGWGLFAGEQIKKNEYIGEYKGEIVSLAESDRRGAIYHHRGLEYLFTLNEEQEIDSSRAGNKMRFINNSCRADIINVKPRRMLCDGVQRIILYADRTIEAGEELFFNYGYPREVTKYFWERDEAPLQSPTAKDLLQGDADMAECEEEAEEMPRSRRKRRAGIPLTSEDIGELPPLRKNKKRKRLDEDIENGVEPPRSDFASIFGLSAAGLPETAEPEADADYSEDGAEEDSVSDDVSEGADGDAEEENEIESEESSGDSDSASSPAAAPKRNIGADDRRFGGQVQKAGWITRKQRQMAKTNPTDTEESERNSSNSRSAQKTT